jgi:hypothetical protein
MPPREAHAVQPAVAGQRCPFALLPPNLLTECLRRLPVDPRMRCAEVCRAWHTALRPSGLWSRLEFSPASGVTARVTLDLIRAAVARAAGALVALDLRCLRGADFDDDGHTGLTAEGVVQLVKDNAGSLRELFALAWWDEDLEALFTPTDFIEQLHLAAPQLTALHVEEQVTPFAEHEANLLLSMLRNEPPYGPLRLRHACLFEDFNESTLRQLLAAMTSHQSLRGLEIDGVDSAALVSEFVDLAVARQYEALSIHHCVLHPACAGLFVQLVRSAALKALYLYCNTGPMLDAQLSAQLATALQSNTTLTELTLGQCHLWAEPAGATAILNALVGHPSIRVLGLWGNQVPDGMQEVAGLAIGAFVAANAPALHTLRVQGCQLGDVGLAPLFSALAANTHLRELGCGRNGMTEAFARSHLLPVVQANTCLRMLYAEAGVDVQSMEDAALIVSERST